MYVCIQCIWNFFFKSDQRITSVNFGIRGQIVWGVPHYIDEYLSVPGVCQMRYYTKLSDSGLSALSPHPIWSGQGLDYWVDCETHWLGYYQRGKHTLIYSSSWIVIYFSSYTLIYFLLDSDLQVGWKLNSDLQEGWKLDFDLQFKSKIDHFLRD